MDEPAIDKAASPIAPMRAWIDNVKDVKSLASAIAQLHAAGFGILFAMTASQDSADARNVIAQIDQGGSGRPIATTT
jgi:predicted metalloendopeptidase